MQLQAGKNSRLLRRLRPYLAMPTEVEKSMQMMSRLLFRYIKEGSFEGFVFDNADVKKDGKVNVADLVKIIDIIKNP